MPLRSPKMYLAILGFHRLVWWPKWTPASSSSFIVIWDIPPPRLGFRFRAPGRPPSSSTRRGCHRCWGACVVWGLAGACVYLNVVLRQVAGPHVIVAGAEAEVHGQRHLGLGQLRLDAFPADAVPGLAVRRHLLVAVPDPDPVLLQGDAGGPDRRHDPSPVRIAARHRRLEERGVGDGAGRHLGIPPGPGPPHLPLHDQRPPPPLPA